ncbi:MAG: NADH-ubiquinone oxidoreductase-F iron-sulfur binding region domain-containing protein [Patescibacteria group bacterium]|jgi:NADH:ubiquinone oxidoreductase subunit F (NADH-binding)
MSTINNILSKISDAGLVGRGGASYPTAKKWTAVKSALAAKKQGYIIVNGAEGEPGVKKDGYLFKHHALDVMRGVHLADQFLGTKKIKKIYLFLNHDYYQNYQGIIRRVLDDKEFRAIKDKVEFFIKPAVLTYISGEETALLNLIEGKKVQPRLKPPYPTEHGLYGRPTLIANPETFYNVSLVAQGKYEEKRFYTVEGFVKHPGVYSLAASATIEEVLKATGNYPSSSFFVQVGGNACGEVLNSEQLSNPVTGAGSVMVYDLERTNEEKLFKYWLNFYQEQSCGQCTSCREGTYRLMEIINRQNIDKHLFWEILETMEDSSFCPLGYNLSVPFKSYFNNIFKQ